MSFDNGFKPKRYDPEPEQEPVSELTIALWCVALFLAAAIVANALAGLTS